MWASEPIHAFLRADASGHVEQRGRLGNLSHGVRRGNGLSPDCSGTQRNLGE